MNISPKQREEVDLAARLLATLGHAQIAIEPSDRPDVFAQVGAMRIGIEVTQFHADEHAGATGSSLRANEERLSRQLPDQSYAQWGISNPNPALVARITDKIAASATYETSSYNQLWLLVSASLPKLGAIGSTFALSTFVNVEELNLSTHQPLSNSSFSAVYLHILLSPALFCWSREKKWHAINVQQA